MTEPVGSPRETSTERETRDERYRTPRRGPDVVLSGASVDVALGAASPPAKRPALAEAPAPPQTSAEPTLGDVMRKLAEMSTTEQTHFGTLDARTQGLTEEMEKMKQKLEQHDTEIEDLKQSGGGMSEFLVGKIWQLRVAAIRSAKQHNACRSILTNLDTAMNHSERQTMVDKFATDHKLVKPIQKTSIQSSGKITALMRLEFARGTDARSFAQKWIELKVKNKSGSPIFVKRDYPQDVRTMIHPIELAEQQVKKRLYEKGLHERYKVRTNVEAGEVKLHDGAGAEANGKGKGKGKGVGKGMVVAKEDHYTGEIKYTYPTHI